ncbi:hypothetical protein IscW_ISCW019084 [Ixodes scapularis]|uniref:Uncharacterized protein n=1 Tax=Ixodes scapularis TaxID=6945 RepID=B7PM16_IXOSC|nr:hypothetical protein IscW_ISCW019084 [Ixodes scapularis]|eukprot:XP_002434814.1 hypothetical protein IscW_ISCW019084 [Ixodes scapularis]
MGLTSWRGACTACVQFLNGFVYSLASTNKPLGKAYVGLWPFVLLYTAEGAEALLKSTTVLNKALLYKLLNSWLGTGLLTRYLDPRNIELGGVS